MLKTLLKILAWLSLFAIVLATLGPMSFRPETEAGPAFERFAAFATTGFLFAAAYPKRLGPVMLMLVATAISLEALQLVIPGRHGHLSDVFIKIAGSLLGVAIVFTAGKATGLYKPAPQPPYRSF